MGGGILSLLGGTAMSVIGQILDQREADANARRRVEARNQALTNTLRMNSKYGDESRRVLDDRLRGVQPDNMAAQQQSLTNTRMADNVAAVTDTPAPELAGSAPEVVQSEVAKRMQDVMNAGRQEARTLGKLGGYGDATFRGGLQTAGAGRDIGVQQGFISGNMALLPHRQDIAELRAYRPMSGVGSILKGFGSMLGSAGGGGFGRDRAGPGYTSPVRA